MQSGFDSDCSLTIMKGATLSTLPSTGLSGIHFLAHLAYSAKVSFSDRALSVVRRRPSSVVRQQFTQTSSSPKH